MEAEKRLVPLEVVVVDVMRLVVHEDERVEVTDPLEHSSTLSCIARRPPTEEAVERVLRRELRSALVELLDVRQEEVPGAGRLGALAPQDHLEIEPPTSRDERQLPKDESV